MKKKREVDHFLNLMAGAASEILRKFFKEKEGVKQSWYKFSGWGMRPSKIVRANKLSHGMFTGNLRVLINVQKSRI